MSNKHIEAYINAVTKEFPVLGEEEKIYIQQFGESISITDSDIVDYNSICEKFGQPSEVVRAYYEDREMDLPVKNRIRKYIIIGITIVVLIAFATFFMSYLEGKKAYTDNVKITIEEE